MTTASLACNKNCLSSGYIFRKSTVSKISTVIVFTWFFSTNLDNWRGLTINMATMTYDRGNYALKYPFHSDNGSYQTKIKCLRYLNQPYTRQRKGIFVLYNVSSRQQIGDSVLLLNMC